MKTENTETLGS